MKQVVHLCAALLAIMLIALFFCSTLLVELFGFILVPAIAATGGSGFSLAGGRRGALVDAKRRRMPFIALNGVLVLVPCAVVLHLWASSGSFDGRFYAVQALELAAGALNLVLMSLNLRDGLRLSGRLRAAVRNVS